MSGWPSHNMGVTHTWISTMLESCDDISLYLEYCKCQIEEHGDKTEKTENLEALLLVLVHAQSTFVLQILKVL